MIYGVSVTGGVVYRGSRLPELCGRYIFADYQSGHIAAIAEQTDGTWGGGATGYGQRLATDSGIVAFGYDPRNGDALFCDISAGQVKRLARSGTTGPPPPSTLSETGVFSDVATLPLATGVVPFSVNVPFWSDYAIKSRWFAVRNASDTVGFSTTGNWSLPTGMVWVKHFDMDVTRGNPGSRRKLETRIPVKTATDAGPVPEAVAWRASAG